MFLSCASVTYHYKLNRITSFGLHHRDDIIGIRNDYHM